MYLFIFICVFIFMFFKNIIFHVCQKIKESEVTLYNNKYLKIDKNITDSTRVLYIVF